MDYLRKLLLLLSIYPILTVLTGALTGVAIGRPVQGLVVGLELAALSLLGVIPLLGPLLYLDLTLILKLLDAPWTATAAMGLVAAISFTVISGKALVDFFRKRRGLA